RQRARPATLLADLLRLAVPSNKKRMDRRQRDSGPRQEGADETVQVPERHRAPLPAGDQRRDKSDDERHPDWLELLQPLNNSCSVHVAGLSLQPRAAALAGDERRLVLMMAMPRQGPG